MSLVAASAQLTQELDSFLQHLKDFVAQKQTLRSAADFVATDEFLLEGILSRIWQSWCLFCRSCVVHSCLGSVSSAGVAVPALAAATSEWHVSNAAIMAKRKAN